MRICKRKLSKLTLPGVSVMSASSPVEVLVIGCVPIDKLSDCSYVIKVYKSLQINS